MSSPPTKKQKMDTSSVVDIISEPKGDMVLKVGKGESAVLVRVHSIFLRVGSEVFHAMLSSNYQEGNKTYTEAEPLVLEDDDPQAFISLCNLLHHRAKLEDKTALAYLPDLAVLVNKYMCAEATKAWFLAALRDCFGDDLQENKDLLKKNGLSVEDVLLISHIIDDAPLFSKASRVAITRCKDADPSTKVSPKLQMLMPESLIANLQAARTHELRNLDTLVEKPLDKALKRLQGQVRDYLCDLRAQFVGHFVFYLAKAKGSLRGFADTKLSLEEAWQVIERFQTTLTRVNLGYCDYCHQYCSQDFAAPVTEAISESKKSLRALCLPCERQGVTFGDQSCSHVSGV